MTFLSFGSQHLLKIKTGHVENVAENYDSAYLNDGRFIRVYADTRHLAQSQLDLSNINVGL